MMDYFRYKGHLTAEPFLVDLFKTFEGVFMPEEFPHLSSSQRIVSFWE